MPDREYIARRLGELSAFIRSQFDGLAGTQACELYREWAVAAEQAAEMLKAQEQRHRLEVHNIGNVDMPECVSEEQFHAVMNNVVAALEHTDKGESWPYDEEWR